jgi:PAS domain S-box-containing protein
MTSINLLKILFIEDLTSDVDLAVLELRKENLRFEYTTVCTRVDLIKSLRQFKPDLIISDYSMPAFNGLKALKLVKEFDPEVPFILYTGSINEETAVECLKAGAQDYVIKEHMTRLPFAVNEVLEQVRIQKEKRASELLLKDSEEKLQSIFAVAPVGIGMVVNRIIMEVNDTFCNLIGYNRSELIGRSSEIFYPSKEEYEFVGIEKYRQIAEKGNGSVETKFKCKNGKILNVILSSAPLDKSDLSKGVTFTVLDITEKEKEKQELKSSYSILNASLESTADGILIVDGKGGIIKWNNKFAKMWQLPEEILENHNDNEAIDFILDKLANPDQFVTIVKELYNNPDKSSFDKLDFKDGRIFERYSQPQRIDNKVVGRVWSFRDVTDRHKAEESLKLSEERFRSIAENLSDIIFITDKEGVIKYVSAACKMFGYSQDEFVGKFFGEFLAEGELEKAMQLFTNALNSINISNIVTLVFKRKDGSKFFAELSGSVFNIDNENIGVLGLIRDVSEKVKREDELRKLSRAVEQSPASILITDTDGNIEYVNLKLCEITGYSKNELIGENPRIFSSGEKSGEEYKSLWDSISEGNDWKSEFHNKKKNGELYWESAIISPIKNSQGKIIHYLGIKEDITGKKESDQKLIESEKRYREMFFHSPVPMWIYEVESLKFVDVNEAAIMNYGYSRDEFLAMTVKNIRPPEDIPLLLDLLSENNTVNIRSSMWRHLRKDGSLFPVEVRSHSIPGENDIATRLVMAIDMTERQKAEEIMKIAREKAEASDKLKTSFLNNISHEVRTPLNGILGFAEIMSQTDLSENEKKDSLSMLFESSDRLLNTITNYMDISLLTSGNMSVHKKDFIPGQILRKTFDNYNALCLNKKLDLSLKIPEQAENLTINSDAEIFQKIISHLLNNAIKFTESGSIHYGYSANEGNLEVFVKDTGIGIGNRFMTNIFDRFVKEDQDQTRLTEGSGLGLAIVKGMVDIIGGKIWVESELGEGSSFIFTIPLLKKMEKAAGNTHDIVHKKLISGASILVAEDDETNYFFLYALLSRETGAKVLHASNGREAIDLFKANPDIILILMDIKMPVIDGLEATRQIKLIKQDVPVIAITAYAMSGDEERVIAAGCDSYLSKPISKKSLLDKMAEFIKI